MRRSTGPDKLTVEALYLRCEGLCEGCGEELWPERGPGLYDHQIAHRRARGAGGTRRPETNDIQSLMVLNRDCHAITESKRVWSVDNGFLVPQSGMPAAKPVLLYGVPAADGREAPHARLVLLSDDAAYIPVSDAELPEVV